MSESHEISHRISVIVPTLNEFGQIEALAPLKREADVIIADGGSTDGTVEQARRLGLRVIESPPGRGMQMNAGAAAASNSEVLLFLHADTRLPTRWKTHVWRTLALPGAAAGAFRFAVDAPGARFRLLERLVRLRPTPYGDQAIFLRREVFERTGGYRDWPVLEDVELIRRVRWIGRVCIAPASAVTSARRWRESGIVRATLVNQRCLWAWRLGVSPMRIARWRRGSTFRNAPANAAGTSIPTDARAALPRRS